MELQNVDMLEAIVALSGVGALLTQILKQVFPSIRPIYFVYGICGSVGLLYGIVTAVMPEDVIARVIGTIMLSVAGATAFYRGMKTERPIELSVEELEKMYKDAKKLTKNK